MKRTFTIIFFFLVLFFLATIVIFPQWSNDPNVNLYVGTGIKPEVCSDSAGGCFVVYEHGPSKQISVRWFDKYGYQPWGWKKIIQGEYPEQWQSKSIDDGKGGIIVSYEDMLDNIPYEYKTRIRVQRINKADEQKRLCLWNNNGLYFFSWSGMKNGVDHIAQFQAFRNNGSNLFPQGSISISEYLQFGIAGLLPSDNFKTITVWSPSSNLTLAQVYDTLGNKIWNEDGVVLAYPALGYKSFTTDGNGGFIIGGTKNEFTIIVQQVSKYGNLGEVIIPVELTSFYANVTKNKVKLFWQTATETNNQGFEINRFTQNGNNAWERIGFVEGFETKKNHCGQKLQDSS